MANQVTPQITVGRKEKFGVGMSPNMKKRNIKSRYSGRPAQ